MIKLIRIIIIILGISLVFIGSYKLQKDEVKNKDIIYLCLTLGSGMLFFGSFLDILNK